MAYSCSDFVDTILDALGIVVPEESQDSPSDQADLALAAINRRHALTDDEAELVRAFREGQGSVLRFIGKRAPPPQWALDGALANDDLEIDDFPMRSEAENGCWVSCWQWVPDPSPEEDHEAEEEAAADAVG